jgi:hypothetical protein
LLVGFSTAPVIHDFCARPPINAETVLLDVAIDCGLARGGLACPPAAVGTGMVFSHPEHLFEGGISAAVAQD